MADFDVQGAKAAGYSDAEIADHLAASRSFDIGAARKSGYSDSEIVQHLAPPAPSISDRVGNTLKQYWDKINPVTQAQGLASLVTTDPRKTVHSYGEQTAQIGQKALDSFKSGDYAGGVRHTLSYFLNGIPGLGSALDEAGNKAGSGDYEGAIADTAALATQIAAAKIGPKVLNAATEPGAASSAASAVTQPVRDLVKSPGNVQIAGGAAGVGGGIAAAVNGHPLEGIAAAAYGAKKVGEGFRLRTAARAATAEVEAAAASKAASDARISANRAANPPRIVTPPERQPLADLSPIPATELPSGRRPGKPAFDARTGEQLSNLPNGEFSGLAPVAYTPPEPATVPQAGETAQSASGPSVSQLTPEQELAQLLTGNPEGGKIPFSKETPPSEVFADKARAARKINVDLISRHMKDVGMTPEVLDTLKPSDWRDIAKSAGVKLPNDLTTTIRDVRDALANNKVTIIDKLSAESPLAKNYKALQAAQKLAKAMQ